MINPEYYKILTHGRGIYSQAYITIRITKKNQKQSIPGTILFQRFLIDYFKTVIN